MIVDETEPTRHGVVVVIAIAVFIVGTVVVLGVVAFIDGDGIGAVLALVHRTTGVRQSFRGGRVLDRCGSIGFFV